MTFLLALTEQDLWCLPSICVPAREALGGKGPRPVASSKRQASWQQQPWKPVTVGNHNRLLQHLFLSFPEPAQLRCAAEGGITSGSEERLSMLLHFARPGLTLASCTQGSRKASRVESQQLASHHYSEAWVYKDMSLGSKSIL